MSVLQQQNFIYVEILISISSFENDDDFLECMPQKVRSTKRLLFYLSNKDACSNGCIQMTIV
jgi:hypothetical protein